MGVHEFMSQRTYKERFYLLGWGGLLPAALRVVSRGSSCTRASQRDFTVVVRPSAASFFAAIDAPRWPTEVHRCSSVSRCRAARRVQQSLGLVFDPDRGEHSLEHPILAQPPPRG